VHQAKQEALNFEAPLKSKFANFSQPLNAQCPISHSPPDVKVTVSKLGQAPKHKPPIVLILLLIVRFLILSFA
jgi:hypothetical protein